MHMSKLFSKCSVFVLVLGLFGATSTQVFGQDWSGAVQLNRGNLWRTIEATTGHPWQSGFNRIHKFDYPGRAEPGAEDVPHYQLLNYEYAYGFYVWANLDGEAEHFKFRSAWFDRVGTGPPPEFMVPLESIEITNNFGLQDPSIPAEQVASAKFRLTQFGLDVAWRSMVWSYPKYDDFIITEYTITNTGEHDVTNFRFAPYATTAIGVRGNDDDYDYDLDREAWYVHDGRSWDDQGDPVEFEFGSTSSDKGDPIDIENPNSVTSHFQAPQYFSMQWTDTSPKSDPGEPDHINFVGGGAEAGPTNRNPLFGDDPQEWFLDAMTYDEPLPAMTEEGTPIAGGRTRTRFDRTPSYIVSTGPYHIPQGESIKLVLVQAAGMMSMERVVAGGEENQAHLIDGRDSLWANMDAAKELIDNNYNISSHPPVTPTHGMGSLEIAELGGRIKIQWPQFPSGYQDPSSGVNDFAGFRVYRSTFRQNGPWNLIADIPKGSAELEDGLVTYVDDEVLVGSPQFYAVTSYDTEGLESGVVNANPLPVAAKWQSTNDLEQVLVYPNPFKLHSRIPENRYQLDFVNIPGRAEIRIYTLAGSLVFEAEHDDGSGDATWTRSTTDSGEPITAARMVNQFHQAIMPGIYIYQVENLVEGHEGETRTGKFVIIK